MRLVRRVFVLGGLAALPGCAGAVYGLPGPAGAAAALEGPSRLRIAAFEVEAIDFMLHFGMIIHSREDRVLYDPAGLWHHPGAVRRHDVTHGMTPALERAYLSRDSLRSSADIWALHLWEADVPDDTARRAVRIADARDPYVAGGCAYGVSSLLHELPGFEDIRPTFVPAALAAQLHGRNDLTYSTRKLGPAPQEA